MAVEATGLSQWQSQLTCPYRLKISKSTVMMPVHLTIMMKQVWDVTQMKSSIGQSRTYPGFPSRSFISFLGNKQVWIRIIVRVEQLQIVTWIGGNYLGEGDKKSALGWWMFQFSWGKKCTFQILIILVNCISVLSHLHSREVAEAPLKEKSYSCTTHPHVWLGNGARGTCEENWLHAGKHLAFAVVL